jgi:hypothetical protein
MIAQNANKRIENPKTDQFENSDFESDFDAYDPDEQYERNSQDEQFSADEEQNEESENEDKEQDENEGDFLAVDDATRKSA